MIELVLGPCQMINLKSVHAKSPAKNWHESISNRAKSSSGADWLIHDANKRAAISMIIQSRQYPQNIAGFSIAYQAFYYAVD